MTSTLAARRRAFARRGLALGALATATALALHHAPAPTPVVATTDAVPAQATVDNDLADAPEVPVATVQLLLSRDPFASVRPAVIVDDPTDGQTDGGGTDGGGGTTIPDDPCTGSGEVVCDGQVVALVDVDATTAVVRVDGVVYTVAEGMTFATSYRVVTIDGSCVTLLYGDDVFTLCEGEQVLK